MTIETINFSSTPALDKEMEFFSQTKEGLDIYAGIQTRDDVIKYIETNPDFVDLKDIGSLLPSGDILDVGVGWGLTTAYLAIKGYTVSCVEPALDSCRNMADFFKRLELTVKIIRGTGEAIDQISTRFDGVVFWSSLHHCDDPVLALKNARHLLRDNGKVILFEPVLRFFRTKAWFYRMLEEAPEKVGHYGGNEHIYRYSEYLGFLKESGFSGTKTRVSIKYSMEPKRAPWDNPARWAIKRGYYAVLKSIATRSSILSRLMLRLSLLTPLITGDRKGRTL